MPKKTGMKGVIRNTGKKVNDKKVIAVDPEIWSQLEARVYKRMGLDPKTIKLAPRQIMTAVLVALEAERGEA